MLANCATNNVDRVGVDVCETKRFAEPIQARSIRNAERAPSAETSAGSRESAAHVRGGQAVAAGMLRDKRR